MGRSSAQAARSAHAGHEASRVIDLIVGNGVGRPSFLLALRFALASLVLMACGQEEQASSPRACTLNDVGDCDCVGVTCTRVAGTWTCNVPCTSPTSCPEAKARVCSSAQVASAARNASM
jgi:hypothetical protein